jgi:hypothetical protein
LGRTFFPDNDWTRNKDGSPIRPYDMSTDTMYEFMGVRVDPVDEAIHAEMHKLTGPVETPGAISKGAAGYWIDGRLNDSFKAANLLLAQGVKMQRIDKASQGLHAGDWVVPSAPDALVTSVAKQTGVAFQPLKTAVTQGTHEATKLRIAMYQRYGGGNIDEGWTRWLIEDFKFPYVSIFDKELKAGNLNAKYDVIVIPEDSTATITGDRPAAGAAGGRGGGGRGGGGGEGGTPLPPEYRTGIGTDGVAALRAFVEKGGSLVTLAGASTFAIERFGLSVRDVVTGKSTKEFWCPGSTLKLEVDNTNPLAYGMQDRALGVYLMGNPAFTLTPTQHNERYEVVANYVSRDLLQSGWLVGEDTLAKQGVAVVAHVGSGRIVLLGIHVQHRAQTYGTFKLLFNNLIG